MSESQNKMPPKWILKTMVAVNVFVYRLTGGRLMSRLKGSPICLVTMTGRKSGRRIVMPLMYTAHEDKVLIVASLGGAPRNPVWYHNLVANPDVSIQIGDKVRPLRARIAGPEEKAKLWPICVASYPPFADYQAKTDRDIPLFVCEPQAPN